jgi:hypothetical protein
MWCSLKGWTELKEDIVTEWPERLGLPTRVVQREIRGGANLLIPREKY